MPADVPSFSLKIPKKNTSKLVRGKSSSLKENPLNSLIKTKDKLWRGSLNESDDGSGDDDTNVVETVTHFDQSVGGAVNYDEIKKNRCKKLVIKPLANRNWQEEVLRRKLSSVSTLSKTDKQVSKSSTQQTVTEKANTDYDTKETSYGLNILPPLKCVYVGSTVSATPQKALSSKTLTESVTEKSSKVTEYDNSDAEDDKEKLMIIPRGVTNTLSEMEVFKQDFDSAPDAPSLEEYAAVPVEQFGAALLRGMGWKDGDPIGKRTESSTTNARKIKLRPHLLGIGAKFDATYSESVLKTRDKHQRPPGPSKT